MNNTLQQVKALKAQIATLNSDIHTATVKTIRFSRGDAYNAICTCGFERQSMIYPTAMQFAADHLAAH